MAGVSSDRLITCVADVATHVSHMSRLKTLARPEGVGRAGTTRVAPRASHGRCMTRRRDRRAAYDTRWVGAHWLGRRMWSSRRWGLRVRRHAVSQPRSAERTTCHSRSSGSPAPRARMVPSRVTTSAWTSSPSGIARDRWNRPTSV